MEPLFAAAAEANETPLAEACARRQITAYLLGFHTGHGNNPSARKYCNDRYRNFRNVIFTVCNEGGEGPVRIGGSPFRLTPRRIKPEATFCQKQPLMV
jgi:hypothetical protein